MSCAEIASLLELLPLHGSDPGDEVLEPAELVRVREHLAGCAACTTYTEELRAAYDRSASAQEEAMHPLSETLRTRLLAELKSKLQAPEGPSYDVATVEALRGQIGLSCSFCRDGLQSDQSVYCAGCLAPHHRECFAEHGQCSMPGCAETRTVQPTEAAPAPAARPKRGLVIPLVIAAIGGVAAAAVYSRPDTPREWARVDQPAQRTAAEEAPVDETVASQVFEDDVLVEEDLVTESPDMNPGEFKVLKRPGGGLNVLSNQADLRAVVAEVARVGRVNAIVGELGQESIRVSPNLIDVTADEAIQAIARLAECETESLPRATWISRPPRVSFDFEQADVRTLLGLLGQYAGQQVFLDPWVRGQISAQCADEDWREALGAFASAVGAHVYRVREGVVLVTHEELAPEVLKELRGDSLLTDLGGLSKGARINLDLEDMSLAMTCKAIELQAEVALVVDPNVDAKISCSLRDVPLSTALVVLQRLSGMEVEVRSPQLAVLKAPAEYTLQVADASIGGVYKLLAAEAGLSYGQNDAITGRVESGHWVGLDPKLALRALAAVHGHRLTVVGGLVTVGPGAWAAPVEASSTPEPSARSQRLTALLAEIGEKAWANEREGLARKQAELRAFLAEDSTGNAAVDEDAARVARAAVDQRVNQLVQGLDGGGVPDSETLAALSNGVQEALAKYAREELDLAVRAAAYNGWFASLKTLGEIGLTVQLQIYVNSGNARLRGISERLKEGNVRAALELVREAELLVALMRAEESPMLINNAEALAKRVRQLKERAVAQLLLSTEQRVEALLVQSGFAAEDRAIVGGQLVHEGSTLGEGELEIVEIDGKGVELRDITSGATFRRALGD